jgi:hypothetical protein
MISSPILTLNLKSVPDLLKCGLFAPLTLQEIETDDYWQDLRQEWLLPPVSLSFPPLSFLSKHLGIATCKFKHRNDQPFFAQTITFWELLTGQRLSSEQARECAQNVVGFIQTLARWEKAGQVSLGASTPTRLKRC